LVCKGFIFAPNLGQLETPKIPHLVRKIFDFCKIRDFFTISQVFQTYQGLMPGYYPQKQGISKLIRAIWQLYFCRIIQYDTGVPDKGASHKPRRATNTHTES
jgi:hypothetical protein